MRYVQVRIYGDAGKRLRKLAKAHKRSVTMEATDLIEKATRAYPRK